MQTASMQNSTDGLPIVTNLTVVHSHVFIVVLLHPASGIRHLASGIWFLQRLQQKAPTLRRGLGG